jgi:hypothetical protein
MAALFRKGKKDEKTNPWLVIIVNASLLPTPACFSFIRLFPCNSLEYIVILDFYFSEIVLAVLSSLCVLFCKVQEFELYRINLKGKEGFRLKGKACTKGSIF